MINYVLKIRQNLTNLKEIHLILQKNILGKKEQKKLLILLSKSIIELKFKL